MCFKYVQKALGCEYHFLGSTVDKYKGEEGQSVTNHVNKYNVLLSRLVSIEFQFELLRLLLKKFAI